MRVLTQLADAGPPMSDMRGLFWCKASRAGNAEEGIMMVLVAYDVETLERDGQRRLRRVAKTCLDYGQRVQKSVFECEVDPAQWVQLRSRLVGMIDQDRDSLRFYFLGRNWRRRVEHVGAHGVPDLGKDVLIV